MQVHSDVVGVMCQIECTNFIGHDIGKIIFHMSKEKNKKELVSDWINVIINKLINKILKLQNIKI